MNRFKNIYWYHLKIVLAPFNERKFYFSKLQKLKKKMFWIGLMGTKTYF
jgi:hypothetical protein